MLKLAEIREMLRDRRPGIVAVATGLHYNTVRDIRDDKNRNPTYTTICALSKYFEDKEQGCNV